MKIGVSIMAHPGRQQQATALADTLAARIAWDTHDRGEVWCGDEAWLMHDPRTDWWIVLQDDAEPIDGFLTYAKAALHYAPSGLVSFYTGTGRPHHLAVGRAVKNAERRGYAWMQHPTLMWGVAVAMPTPMVPVFMRWGHSSRLTFYDKRLSAFAGAIDKPVRYTNPSLVDHADGPTLLRHPWGEPTMRRKAWTLGAPKTWDTAALEIPA